MPNVSDLFGTPDIVARKMLVEAGMCKTHDSDNKLQSSSCKIDSNGVDNFKSMHLIDNNYVEVTCTRISQQRAHYVKFGCCEETPESLWNEHKKGEGRSAIEPPMILGQCRIALKFINKVFTKHIKSTDLHEVILANNEEDKFIEKRTMIRWMSIVLLVVVVLQV